jgi:cyclopropane fatty-acyl-phospholipid synthase-like methyltransferase
MVLGCQILKDEEGKLTNEDVKISIANISNVLKNKINRTSITILKSNKMKKNFPFFKNLFLKENKEEIDLSFYQNMTYLDAYAHHTDLRVERNPKEAIGGKWDEIGNLQFDFLKRRGLRPSNSMLDIGCGTLRGGRFFINYLNKSNYWGFDISEKAIEYANQLIKNEGLAEKEPHLFVNAKNLKSSLLINKKFDFLLAQSVFTHLFPEHIEDYFQDVAKLMTENSKFYFTFSESTNFYQRSPKDFSYPYSFFEELAKKYSLKIENISKEYNHQSKKGSPGQKMAEIMVI